MHESIYADWTLLFFGLGFFMLAMKFTNTLEERRWQRRMDEKREFEGSEFTRKDKTHKPQK